MCYVETLFMAWLQKNEAVLVKEILFKVAGRASKKKKKNVVAYVILLLSSTFAVLMFFFYS